ncbi:MAG: hypothetical protein EB165_06690 [Euryarchaeota archaeon]|nr:hypothetical protein [Euryarchaeota archaeon]NDB94310.1 hypothetical protein [Euryarchaeota archaeon]
MWNKIWQWITGNKKEVEMELAAWPFPTSDNRPKADDWDSLEAVISQDKKKPARKKAPSKKKTTAKKAPARKKAPSKK